jgi:hypothetical protein
MALSRAPAGSRSPRPHDGTGRDTFEFVRFVTETTLD